MYEKIYHPQSTSPKEINNEEASVIARKKYKDERL